MEEYIGVSVVICKCGFCKNPCSHSRLIKMLLRVTRVSDIRESGDSGLKRKKGKPSHTKAFTLGLSFHLFVPKAFGAGDDFSVNYNNKLLIC